MNNYITYFLEMMAAERGVSSLTLSSYNTDLKIFFTFLNQKDPLTVSSQEIHAYQVHLNKEGKSSSTIRRHLSSLRQFFLFLLSEELRFDNPAEILDSPRTARPLPKTLTEEEVVSLLSYAQEMPGPEGKRLSCLLEILYATGLRVSELLHLPFIQTSSLEGIPPCFIIQGKGQRERKVLLTPVAHMALINYLKVRDFFLKKTSKWLFPSKGGVEPLTRQRLGQLLKEVALKSGLDPQKVSPHILRHAFATHLLTHGADLRSVQKMLGHASLVTTQIYTHLTISHLHKVVHDYHPLSLLSKTKNKKK